MSTKVRNRGRWSSRLTATANQARAATNERRDLQGEPPHHFAKGEGNYEGIEDP